MNIKEHENIRGWSVDSVPQKKGKMLEELRELDKVDNKLVYTWGALIQQVFEAEWLDELQHVKKNEWRA